MTKELIKMHKDYIFDTEKDVTELLNWINLYTLLNVESDEKEEKIVSFFDGDDECYFILTFPPKMWTDIDLLDLVDEFGRAYGITYCKYDGEVL